MAKQSALQLVNKILENLGEVSDLSVLTGLSGLSLMVFNVLNEVLYDVGINYFYSPLEEDGTITLSSNYGTYAVPSDMYDYDKDSFRYDNKNKMEYYTPQRLDREYPDQTDVNIPDKISKWKDHWRVVPICNTSGSGKTVDFRYWKNPTVFATDTPNGTCWFPEGFDLTLLADYVTYKILHYKSNPEAQVYYVKVFGDGRNERGGLAQLQERFGSPQIEDENIFVEPL